MREVGLGQGEFEDLSSEVLARGGCVCFQARGFSMRPFVCSGDILTIEPSESAAIRVGDVAFYLGAGNKLTAHRVVGLEGQSAKSVLLVRGDAHLGPAEQISIDQVMGRVVYIRRKGRILSLDQPVRRWTALLWIKTSPLGPGLLRLPGIAHHGVLWLLGRLHAFRPYRHLARKRIGERTDFRLATVRDTLELSRLYGYERLPSSWDPVKAMSSQLTEADGASHTVVATLGDRIVGATGIRTFPDNAGWYPDWWLSSLLVQTRYRGSGIGEGLVRVALETALSEGATRVNLLVFEDNKVAVRFYRKMGFRPASIAGLDAQLEEEAWQGRRRRIIMSRSL